MLPKTRYALIADTHIENNKNLPYVISTFDWVVDTLVSRNIKHLIILGDFVNSRFRMDILALNRAIDILNKLYDAGIKVFILLGNHERYYKETDFSVTSIRPFEKHSIIISDVKTIHGDGFNFICIPNVETNEEFVELVGKVSLDKSKKNILLAHCGITGATTNDLYNITDLNGVEASILHKFDRVFLGHYHKRQEIGNILYVGSPVQLSFGEEFSEKGITIWNAEDNSTELVLNPNYDLYMTVVDTKEDVKGKFVRFISNQFIDAAEARNVKETLLQNGALEAKIEIKHKAFEEVAKAELNGELDLKDVIQKYIELNCVHDKVKCYDKCVEIMKET